MLLRVQKSMNKVIFGIQHEIRNKTKVHTEYTHIEPSDDIYILFIYSIIIFRGFMDF